MPRFADSIAHVLVSCCVALLCAASFGCNGAIGGLEPGPFAPGPGLEPGTPETPALPEPILCESDVTRVSTEALRRLSVREYTQVLAQMLPREAIDAAQGDLVALPADNTEPGEFDRELHSTLSDPLFDAAERMASVLVTSTDWLESMDAACIAEGLAEDDASETCVEAFFADLAELLWRRPVTEDELALYVELYAADSEGYDSQAQRVANVVAALLSDPEFMLVIPTVDAEQNLSPHSVATRLALQLTGSAPDAALRDAADDGSLLEEDTRLIHAERLARSAAGRTHLRSLFAGWLDLEAAVDISAPAGIYGYDPDGLWEELRNEALDVVEYVVFEEEGSYQDLLETDLEAASTARLADLMEQDEASATPQASRTGRVGLLARPALMATPNEIASPILRGVRFLERILCRHLAAPPAEADAIADMLLSEIDLSESTSRERTAHATSPAACAGCHNAINPLGYLFSAFGPVGQPWTEGEITLNEDSSPSGRKEVDDTVERFVLDGEELSLSGTAGIAEALSASEEAQLCAGLQLFRITHLRDPEPSDACHLGDITQGVRNNESILNILVRQAALESIQLSDGTGRSAR
ncbi:MAG: DUF1592 domain-containing protein [Polyangiales bacterium]